MTMLTSRADGEANSGYGNENQVQSPVSTPMPSVPNNSGKQEEDDLPF
jgi:hypothetical protein